MRYACTLGLVLLASVPVSAAEKYEVAQYIADVDDVSWRVGSEASTTKFSDGISHPWGLDQNEAGTTLQRGIQLGRYQLSGIFDIYHRESSAGDRPFDKQSTVSLGSGVSFSPDSITQLFHSLSDAESLDHNHRNRWGGDSQSQRTGLTQTWYFARRRAHITLGYGFERGDTENLYDDMRGHSIVLSSRFPLFWGLSARIEADYAHNSYQEYQGVDEADSDRQLFQAAIDHSLSQRLYGEVQFSYLNEDFDDSELSYRRYVWGLNLRYRY